MLKVMIVDDEILTRIGIASMCNWSEHGIIIAQDADNGRDALEMAEREQPDIILTDIKMPVMNGIEFIREAKKRGLKSKFVILSAYSEFEYVREGMKLGAEDYLLKLELEPDKLIQLLGRIAEKICMERDASHSVSPSKKVYKINYEHTKMKCIYNILTGMYDTADMMDKALKKAGLEIKPENLVCIAIQSAMAAGSPDGAHETDMQFSLDNAMLRALNELIRNYGTGYGCVMRKNVYCMLVSLNSVITPAFDTSYYLKMKTDITKHIKSTFGINLSVYITNPVNDYIKLSQIFRQIPIFSDPLNSSTINTPLQKQENDLHFSFGTEISRIDEVLSCSRIDELNAAFSGLIRKIGEHGAIPSRVLHGICHTLIHIADSFISRNSYLSANWSRSDELLLLIKDCKTQEQYLSYIQLLYERLNQMVNSDKNYKSIIIKAKKFIEQNYQKDISLESTALHINLSPAYFSRLFSRETGGSFIDYLTALRVEHAREYLKNTNKKVHEISELVGYKNPYYFSRIFKKITGVTPLEYRK